MELELRIPWNLRVNADVYRFIRCQQTPRETVTDDTGSITRKHNYAFLPFIRCQQTLRETVAGDTGSITTTEEA